MNENIKNEFLDCFSDSYRKLTSWVFSSCKQFEDLYNKDLCDFIEKDIYNAFRALNVSSIQSLESRISVLRKYTDWCIERNINKDHINHYEFIERQDLIKFCLNTKSDDNKIFSRQEVIEFSNQTVRPGDAYMILAAFEGIGSRGFSEMAYLRMKDIVGNTFNLNGLIIPVSIQLRETAIESIECYEYENIIGKKFYLEDSSNYAIKPMRGRIFEGEEFIREKINKRFKHLQNDIDSRITFTNLKKSGIIYSIKQIMDEKQYGFEDMLHSEEFKDVKIRFNLQDRPDFKLRANYKNYFN